MILYSAAAVVLAYSGVAALVYFNQQRAIYPVPAIDSSIPYGFDLVHFTTPDGLTLASGYRPAREGMPTLLFFHGNGASWQSSAVVTDQLAQAGYGVLAAEYRGYGGNPGSPSEGGLYEDARGAWQYLRAQGVVENDIVLVGNSIGSGVATKLATEVNAQALVLISPFDSLEETASRKVRWLPVRMLLRDRYDNVGKVAEIDEPILVLHGEADTLIELDQAQALASARDGIVMETYAGWGHDLVVHHAVQERIAAFIEDT